MGWDGGNSACVVRVDDGLCKIALRSVLLSMEVDGSMRLASMYPSSSVVDLVVYSCAQVLHQVNMWPRTHSHPRALSQCLNNDLDEDISELYLKLVS